MLFAGGALTGAYGQGDLASVEDIDIFWGIEQSHSIYQAGYEAFDDGTVDTGNPSGSNHLRTGLIIGQIAATKLLTHWDPTATDGSEIPRYVLLGPVNIAPYGVAAAGQRAMRLLAGGRLLADQLVMPGSAARGISGHAYEHVLVSAFKDRFIMNRTQSYARPGGIRNLIANTTLTAEDNGLHIENNGATGAVTVTLPTAARGMEFSFFKSVNQTFTVAGVITDTTGTAQTSQAITQATGKRYVARNVAGTVRWCETAL
jgi:hypothetical protein